LQKIKFNDTVDIYYDDGRIDINIAVTGWLVSELSDPKNLSKRGIKEIKHSKDTK